MSKIRHKILVDCGGLCHIYFSVRTVVVVAALVDVFDLIFVCAHRLVEFESGDVKLTHVVVQMLFFPHGRISLIIGYGNNSCGVVSVNVRFLQSVAAYSQRIGYNVFAAKIRVGNDVEFVTFRIMFSRPLAVFHFYGHVVYRGTAVGRSFEIFVDIGDFTAYGDCRIAYLFDHCGCKVAHFALGNLFLDVERAGNLLAVIGFCGCGNVYGHIHRRSFDNGNNSVRGNGKKLFVFGCPYNSGIVRAGYCCGELYRLARLDGCGFGVKRNAYRFAFKNGKQMSGFFGRICVCGCDNSHLGVFLRRGDYRYHTVIGYRKYVLLRRRPCYGFIVRTGYCCGKRYRISRPDFGDGGAYNYVYFRSSVRVARHDS